MKSLITLKKQPEELILSLTTGLFGKRKHTMKILRYQNTHQNLLLEIINLNLEKLMSVS